MSSDVPELPGGPPEQEQGGIGGKITKFCTALTNAFGSVPSFVIVVIWLIAVYAFLPIVGYDKWNTGIGLFSNSNGSNIELITGVGSMVMINALHKGQTKHQKRHEHILLRHAAEVARLHARLDHLLAREHAPQTVAAVEEAQQREAEAGSGSE